MCIENETVFGNCTRVSLKNCIQLDTLKQRANKKRTWTGVSAPPFSYEEKPQLKAYRIKILFKLFDTRLTRMLYSVNVLTSSSSLESIDPTQLSTVTGPRTVSLRRYPQDEQLLTIN